MNEKIRIISYFQRSFFLILLLVEYAISGNTEIIKENSKYESEEYLKFFKIPDSMMTYNSSGGELRELKNAFDGKYDTFWISQGKQGEIFKNLISNITYESLVNNVVITFSNTVLIDRMLYQSYPTESCPGFGFPNELKIYYKVKDRKGELSEDEEDYILADDIFSSTTQEKVLFTFKNTIKCDQIKIEWTKISNDCDISFEGYATAAEIMLFIPETEHLNENLLNVYDPKDYAQLTITKEFQDIELIEQLKEEVKDLKFVEYPGLFVERLEAIFNGSLLFQPKREFSISGNTLYQRGNIESYAHNELKMRRAGTNRQSTGIYGRPNETITFYVSAKENDPLPSFRFTQFLGTIAKWQGNEIKLKRGINSFKFNDFEVNHHTIKTIPGGPIYLINPYTSDEQSQNVKIYIEGGVLFPFFRINEDEEEYKNSLNDYIKILTTNKGSYLDITEFYSNRVMITVRASDAYKIYNSKEKGPQSNLNKWERYLKKLLIFDGIQFKENQPYYDEKNYYINLHFRFTQPDTLEIANYQYIAIFSDEWIFKIIDLDEKEIGFDIPKEIGNMIDLSDRVVVGTTNYMISKYSETYIQLNENFELEHYREKLKSLTLDNIDNLSRGCIKEKNTECLGFFRNQKYNYLIWWDLESLYQGYWGKLENMYRYNSFDTLGMTKSEKFVYFTNIILGMDLGYYFTRWGFYLDYDKKVFDVNDVSEKYEKLMEEAIEKGLINDTIRKKYWYLDNKEYNYIENSGAGCFKQKDVFDVQIENVFELEGNNHEIILPLIECSGFLGFEIYEEENLLGFTYNNSFVDDTKYGKNSVPKYRIIAFDRYLDTSYPSKYKSVEKE